MGAFMRCDQGAEFVDHHTLFLLGTGQTVFNHAAFEVADFDDLMAGHSHLRDPGLAELEHAHSWGVGRHFMGSQVFDYWLDPWGHMVEHWTDGDLFDNTAPTNVESFRTLRSTPSGAQQSRRKTVLAPKHVLSRSEQLASPRMAMTAVERRRWLHVVSADWISSDATGQREGGEAGHGREALRACSNSPRLRERCPVASAKPKNGVGTGRSPGTTTSSRRSVARMCSGSGRMFMQIPDFFRGQPGDSDRRWAARAHGVPAGAQPLTSRPSEWPRSAGVSPEGTRDACQTSSAKPRSMSCRTSAGPVAAEALRSRAALPRLVRRLIARSARGQRIDPAPAAGGARRLRRGHRSSIRTASSRSLPRESRQVVAERREHPLDPDEDVITGALEIEIDGHRIDDLAITGIGVADLWSRPSDDSRQHPTRVRSSSLSNPGDHESTPPPA